MRKPVYAICEQQRRSSACSSAQFDQHLCCSLPRYYDISSFYIGNFMTLASFFSWADQFESYLVANPEVRFLVTKLKWWIHLNTLKIRTPKIITVIILKFEECSFTIWKGAGRTANSADPDQTVPSGVIWSGSSPGLQKTDFLPVQTNFYFVKPIQFA